ncbi:MAG: polysaccharide deacetylase family protein [Melioribacter sp.]|nr:polysaccharide deacetylase family protein [Melioribacter sp.]
MKFSKLLILLFILINNLCLAQIIDKSYEIATWYGFRSAAVTYTFDDNCYNQLAKVVPMFDEYGFKLTLFTVTNWNPDWRGLQKAADNGHEIASHTVTHTSLNSLSNDRQNDELLNSQVNINSKILNQKCITLAYPYCNTGNIDIVKKYYIAARGCQGYIEDSTPSNFYNISSIICGSQGSVKTSYDFKSRVESTARKKGWCVYLLHGIDNDGGYSPLSSDTLRKSLDYLKVNEDKFWVTSFVNAVKYIKERNCVDIKEIISWNDSIKLSVTDTLDNIIYDHPITIRRILPESWNSCSVKQSGKLVDYKIVELDSKKYVVFNVIPDKGEILIAKNYTTDLKECSNYYVPELYDNYPNPFNPVTRIRFKIPYSNINYKTTLTVHDILGNKIETLINEFKPQGVYEVLFDGSKYPSGIYFYKLQFGNTILVKKMAILK